MIQQLGIGLVVVILGMLIIAAFRVRQLYVVVPRLFSKSHLTTSGKLVEIRVLNRGRITEEDVRVTLDPSIHYEVVASSDSSPSLDATIICIPRIPPGDDCSVLLLVEGGEFSNDRISTISSKSSKGKLLSNLDQVPPNVGNFLLGAIAAVALVASPIAGMEYYSNWKKVAGLERLSGLADSGWSELERYSESGYRKNYSDGEFPIHQLETIREGNTIVVKFRVINKAAADLRLSMQVKWPHMDQDPERWKSTRFESQNIAPEGVKDLTVRLYWPMDSKGTFEVYFTMSVGDERFLQATKLVYVDV